MNERISAALAWGAVSLAGALWGGGALVAQWLIDGGIAPQSLSLARFVLGLPLLWFWHWRARASTAGTADASWSGLAWREQCQVLGTGAAMALSVTCWFLGIVQLGAALPTVISICCAPVIVALVSLVRGYEAVSVRLAVGLLLAIAGVAFLVWPETGFAVSGGDYAQGLAWSFGSALFYALVVLGNARMPRRVPAVTASAWGMSAAALCMLVVVALNGVSWPAHAMQWAGIAYTGVITSSVGYLAFAWGARRLSPTGAVVGTLVEPLVAAVLAALCLSQPLSLRQWIGALMLAWAMALMARRR